MPYKTRQVQNMLTKAELEMFSQSRRDAIGEHTRKQLDAKIVRTRKMRDKYRDLYQRQTVQSQREEPESRKKFGGENARTLVKADVMNSVLERFEAQRSKLQSKAERKTSKAGKRKDKAATHMAPGAPAQRTNPPQAQTSRRDAPTTRVKGNADMPLRGATKRKKRDVQRDALAVSEKAKAVVQTRGNKSSRKAKADTAKTKKSVERKAAKASHQEAAMSMHALKKSVGKALKKMQKQVDDVQAKTTTAGHKHDAVISGKTSGTAQGAVPTHMPAKALRKNPLKAQPINKKIHASQRGRTQAHQAARDAR